MNDTTRTLETLVCISVLLLSGCARDASRDLTDIQKYEMAKQCVDAGMWPDIYSRFVRCMAVPKTQVER